VTASTATSPHKHKLLLLTLLLPSTPRQHHHHHHHEADPVSRSDRLTSDNNTLLAGHAPRVHAISQRFKGAITSKIKHAIKHTIKHKTSPARLAQLLQPSLAYCFSLQTMTA